MTVKWSAFSAGAAIAAADQFVGLQGGVNVRWTFTQLFNNVTAHMLWPTDNTFDIGASGATRPRNVYVGTSLFVASSIQAGAYVTSTTGGFIAADDQFIGTNARGGFLFPADGVITVRNNANTDFGRLQFGGTTSSFPALKRATTGLIVRLADDSLDTSLEALSLLLNGSAATNGSIKDSTTTNGWGISLPSAANTNGQFARFEQVTELVTIGAGATTDSTIQIPAGGIAYAASVRVTVVIPTAATFDVGVPGATTRYGTGISTAATTTYAGTDDGMRFYGTATAIRFTPNASPAANTGRVRLTIHYMAVTAPTS